MYPEAEAIKSLIDNSKTILIIQADNPDGDSLGSAIALEQILTALGKEPHMILKVNLPGYLHYISGWDRLEYDLPNKFDLSIIVDTSSLSLLDNLQKDNSLNRIKQKPLIVIDHHQTDKTITFTQVYLNVPSASATGEVIYELCRQLEWQIPINGKQALAAAILSDSLGLTTQSVSARTVHIIAELIEAGVSIHELENMRRDMMRKSPDIVHYKGRLLERIEYYEDNTISILTIPWEEIEKYSPIYNPAVLALDDMRLTDNTAIAIVLKQYPDNKITAKIRANYNAPIADKLAEMYGGGGHKFASGFKINNNNLIELKENLVQTIKGLLSETI